MQDTISVRRWQPLLVTPCCARCSVPRALTRVPPKPATCNSAFVAARIAQISAQRHHMSPYGAPLSTLPCFGRSWKPAYSPARHAPLSAATTITNIASSAPQCAASARTIVAKRLQTSTDPLARAQPRGPGALFLELPTRKRMRPRFRFQSKGCTRLIPRCGRWLDGSRSAINQPTA